ncbi:MAG: SDR family NAD(P)-dependent oxidoreductase, partial [Actinomycetota bacterium]
MSALLEGKAAIVVGVGPGIGHDTAIAFAREGADVVLAARNEDRLREIAGEIEAMGRRVVSRAADITDENESGELIRAAADAFGRIDVLVNNAFVQPPI